MADDRHHRCRSGRLLTYLEASLSTVAPHVRGVRPALAHGLAHVEAAGLLADALGSEPVLLVLDDLERLGDAPEPWALIDSLLRQAPPSLHALLISRREVSSALSSLRPAPGLMAAMGDADLSFTPPRRPRPWPRWVRAMPTQRACQATGGWVTGVLFEAWRSAEHVPGMGGEADPLHGYLSAQILAELCPADRDFLIETAVLHEVTPVRAAALGRADAAASDWRRCAQRTFRSRGCRGSSRCAATRAFTSTSIACLGDGQSRFGLRLAHGRLLADEGLHEEATEELLAAGAPEDAFQSAPQAIFPVIERLDYATAERWLATLEGVGAPGPYDWRGRAAARARAPRLREQPAHQRPPAHRGEREALAASSERAAALMAWNYFDMARVRDSKAVLAVAPEGPAIEAVRFAAAPSTCRPASSRSRPSRRAGRSTRRS